jgi:hypothetical protein
LLAALAARHFSNDSYQDNVRHRPSSTATARLKPRPNCRTCAQHLEDGLSSYIQSTLRLVLSQVISALQSSHSILRHPRRIATLCVDQRDLWNTSDLRLLRLEFLAATYRMNPLSFSDDSNLHHWQK